MIMNPTAIKHVVVDGHSLTLESFVAIARYNATVELAPSALEAMKKSPALAEKIAAEGRVACAEVGNTRKIIKTKSAETVRTSAAYDRLANMGQRLLEVIRHNQGGANKDLAKFASQIAALCDKWDR